MEKLILKLHQAATLKELCELCLTSLQNLFKTPYIYIQFYPESANSALYLDQQFHPISSKKIMELFHGYQPWLPCCSQGPRFSIIRHSNYFSEQDLKKRAFYQRSLKKQHLQYGCSFSVWQKKEWLTVITLFKATEQGDFSDEDLGIIRQIHPHLTIAVQRLLQKEHEETKRNSLDLFLQSFPSPFLLFDWNLTLLQTNAKGRQICMEWHYGEKLAQTYKNEPPLIPDYLLDKLRQFQLEMNDLTASSRLLWREVELPGSYLTRLTYIPTRSSFLRTGMFLALLESKSTASIPPLENALLTPSEQKVCTLVRRGLNNIEIAHALNKSNKTIRNQLTAIYRKLQVTHRYQLISKSNS